MQQSRVKNLRRDRFLSLLLNNHVLLVIQIVLTIAALYTGYHAASYWNMFFSLQPTREQIPRFLVGPFEVIDSIVNRIDWLHTDPLSIRKPFTLLRFPVLALKYVFTDVPHSALYFLTRYTMMPPLFFFWSASAIFSASLLVTAVMFRVWYNQAISSRKTTRRRIHLRKNMYQFKDLLTSKISQLKARQYTGISGTVPFTASLGTPLHRPSPLLSSRAITVPQSMRHTGHHNSSMTSNHAGTYSLDYFAQSRGLRANALLTNDTSRSDMLSTPILPPSHSLPVPGLSHGASTPLPPFSSSGQSPFVARSHSLSAQHADVPSSSQVSSLPLYDSLDMSCQPALSYLSGIDPLANTLLGDEALSSTTTFGCGILHDNAALPASNTGFTPSELALGQPSTPSRSWKRSDAFEMRRGQNFSLTPRANDQRVLSRQRSMTQQYEGEQPPPMSSSIPASTPQDRPTTAQTQIDDASILPPASPHSIEYDSSSARSLNDDDDDSCSDSDSALMEEYGPDMTNPLGVTGPGLPIPSHKQRHGDVGPIVPTETSTFALMGLDKDPKLRHDLEAWDTSGELQTFLDETYNTMRLSELKQSFGDDIVSKLVTDRDQHLPPSIKPLLMEAATAQMAPYKSAIVDPQADTTVTSRELYNHVTSLRIALHTSRLRSLAREHLQHHHHTCPVNMYTRYYNGFTKRDSRRLQLKRSRTHVVKALSHYISSLSSLPRGASTLSSASSHHGRSRSEGITSPVTAAFTLLAANQITESPVTRPLYSTNITTIGDLINTAFIRYHRFKQQQQRRGQEDCNPSASSSPSSPIAASSDEQVSMDVPLTVTPFSHYISFIERLLPNLTPTDYHDLQPLFQTQFIRNGATLFQQHEPVEYCYLLCEGEGWGFKRPSNTIPSLDSLNGPTMQHIHDPNMLCVRHYLPGDFLGLEALADDALIRPHHSNSTGHVTYAQTICVGTPGVVQTILGLPSLSRLSHPNGSNATPLESSSSTVDKSNSVRVPRPTHAHAAREEHLAANLRQLTRYVRSQGSQHHIIASDSLVQQHQQSHNDGTPTSESTHTGTLDSPTSFSATPTTLSPSSHLGGYTLVLRVSTRKWKDMILSNPRYLFSLCNGTLGQIARSMIQALGVVFPSQYTLKSRAMTPFVPSISAHNLYTSLDHVATLTMPDQPLPASITDCATISSIRMESQSSDIVTGSFQLITLKRGAVLDCLTNIISPYPNIPHVNQTDLKDSVDTSIPRRDGYNGDTPHGPFSPAFELLSADQWSSDPVSLSSICQQSFLVLKGHPVVHVSTTDLSFRSSTVIDHNAFASSLTDGDDETSLGPIPTTHERPTLPSASLNNPYLSLDKRTQDAVVSHFCQHGTSSPLPEALSQPSRSSPVLHPVSSLLLGPGHLINAAAMLTSSPQDVVGIGNAHISRDVTSLLSSNDDNDDNDDVVLLVLNRYDLDHYLSQSSVSSQSDEDRSSNPLNNVSEWISSLADHTNSVVNQGNTQVLTNKTAQSLFFTALSTLSAAISQQVWLFSFYAFRYSFNPADTVVIRSVSPLPELTFVTSGTAKVKYEKVEDNNTEVETVSTPLEDNPLSYEHISCTCPNMGKNIHIDAMHAIYTAQREMFESKEERNKEWDNIVSRAAEIKHSGARYETLPLHDNINNNKDILLDNGESSEEIAQRTAKERPIYAPIQSVYRVPEVSKLRELDTTLADLRAVQGNVIGVYSVIEASIHLLQTHQHYDMIPSTVIQDLSLYFILARLHRRETQDPVEERMRRQTIQALVSLHPSSPVASLLSLQLKAAHNTNMKVTTTRDSSMLHISLNASLMLPQLLGDLREAYKTEMVSHYNNQPSSPSPVSYPHRRIMSQFYDISILYRLSHAVLATSTITNAHTSADQSSQIITLVDGQDTNNFYTWSMIHANTARPHDSTKQCSDHPPCLSASAFASLPTHLGTFSQQFCYQMSKTKTTISLDSSMVYKLLGYHNYLHTFDPLLSISPRAFPPSTASSPVSSRSPSPGPSSRHPPPSSPSTCDLSQLYVKRLVDMQNTRLMRLSQSAYNISSEAQSYRIGLSLSTLSRYYDMIICIVEQPSSYYTHKLYVQHIATRYLGKVQDNSLSFQSSPQAPPMDHIPSLSSPSSLQSPTHSLTASPSISLSSIVPSEAMTTRASIVPINPKSLIHWNDLFPIPQHLSLSSQTQATWPAWGCRNADQIMVVQQDTQCQNIGACKFHQPKHSFATIYESTKPSLESVVPDALVSSSSSSSSSNMVPPGTRLSQPAPSPSMIVHGNGIQDKDIRDIFTIPMPSQLLTYDTNFTGVYPIERQYLAEIVAAGGQIPLNSASVIPDPSITSSVYHVPVIPSETGTDPRDQNVFTVSDTLLPVSPYLGVIPPEPRVICSDAEHSLLWSPPRNAAPYPVRYLGRPVPHVLVLVHPPCVELPLFTRKFLTAGNRRFDYVLHTRLLPDIFPPHHDTARSVSNTELVTTEQDLIEAPFHIFSNDSHDIARIVRFVTGNLLGLALGGGGARGISHLGAVSALLEQGLYPDTVSGTSQGAYMGSVFCSIHPSTWRIDSQRWRHTYSIKTYAIPTKPSSSSSSTDTDTHIHTGQLTSLPPTPSQIHVAQYTPSYPTTYPSYQQQILEYTSQAGLSHRLWREKRQEASLLTIPNTAPSKNTKSTLTTSSSTDIDVPFDVSRSGFDLSAYIARIDRFCTRMSSPTTLLADATLPILSYFAGTVMNTVVIDSMGRYGDCAHIEDTWLPFVAISTNLSRADINLHREGKLWSAIRTSMGVLGLLPPMHDPLTHDLSIDGGYLENLPATPLKQFFSTRFIVAIDVENKDEGAMQNIVMYDDIQERQEKQQRRKKRTIVQTARSPTSQGTSMSAHDRNMSLIEPRSDPTSRHLAPGEQPFCLDSTSMSGWRLLWLRLVRSFVPLRDPRLYYYPSFGAIVSSLLFIAHGRNIRSVGRYIDCYIRPDVQAFGLLDYDRRVEITKRGYERGRLQVEQFINSKLLLDPTYKEHDYD